MLVLNESNLILSISIPNYIRQVQLSKSRRTLYYEWKNDLGIRSWKTKDSKGKQIPKKYVEGEVSGSNFKCQPDNLKSRYSIAVVVNNQIKGVFHRNISLSHQKPDYLLNYCVNCKYLTLKQREKAKCLLYDNVEQKLVIANPKVASTPRLYTINGQDFYSGNLQPIVRAKVVSEIKKFFVDSLVNQNGDTPIFFSHLEEHLFPLIVVCEVHDTIKNKFDKTKSENGVEWDIGNRAYLPYLKTMLDLLATGEITKEVPAPFQPILKADDRLHIAGEMVLFKPIPEYETRKLIFRFYKHKF